MAYTYKYPRPAVTADCIVITKEVEPKVLLIERGDEPFKGCWAFPGGFMNMDETTEQCAIRELEEETGLKVSALHQIGAYSKVNRDPRGRTVTVAYLAIIDKPMDVKGQDDAAKAQWFALSAFLDKPSGKAERPELAFDHNEIMRDAISLYNQIKINSMKQVINTSAAPAAIGPYSQAILVGNLVYTSGQIPIDPATGSFIEGGIKEQTHQSLSNVQAILSEAGLSMSNVIKTTVFMADMNDFAAMNEVYAEFFTEPYPARSAVAVKTLPKGALVEIEVIAAKD